MSGTRAGRRPGEDLFQVFVPGDHQVWIVAGVVRHHFDSNRIAALNSHLRLESLGKVAPVHSVLCGLERPGFALNTAQQKAGERQDPCTTCHDVRTTAADCSRG